MTDMLEAPAPDLDAVKQRQQQAWASGDFAVVAARIVLVAEHLCDTADLHAGWRVLDVATGSGNAAIAAARHGCAAVGVDYVPSLLEAGRRRAEASGLELEWTEADAENLPFEDGSYDVVMSSSGAMFAPHHQDVADQFVRVCRPGGTIGLLCWTPEGMIGALFKAMGPYAPPPPPGAQPPPLWGSEDHVRELFGDRVEWRTMERDMLDITAFEHPGDYGEHFKAKYGPTIVARANAEQAGRAEEFDDVLARFCDEWNLGTADKARFEHEYLLIVGTRA